MACSWSHGLQNVPWLENCLDRGQARDLTAFSEMHGLKADANALHSATRNLNDEDASLYASPPHESVCDMSLRIPRAAW